MPTELLTIGSSHTLVQNRTYSLPAWGCIGFAQGSGVEMSNDDSTWQAVTLGTNKEFEANGIFIRSTAVGTLLTLKLR